jgi:hypothetical protein
MTKIYNFGFGLTSLQTLPRLPRKMGFCATQHSNKLLICEPQLSENMVSSWGLGGVSVRSSNATSR